MRGFDSLRSLSPSGLGSNGRRRVAKVAAGVLAAAAIGVALVPDPGLYPERGRGSTAWLDSDGRLLRLTLSRDDKYRERASLAEQSPLLVQATLLQEDQWFYEHPGVNPISLGRAVKSMFTGERRIGASTITMQLARMRFELDTRRPWGKLVQIARALQLERHHSKDEILEAYLNLAPYGANVEGAAAASRVWFHKTPADLTLAEAVTLAVIPQNPSKRSPMAAGAEARETAAAALLARWVALHPEDTDASLALASLRTRKPSELPFRAPHFVDAEIARGDVRSGAMTTTLDAGLQRLLERQVAAYVERERGIGIVNGAAMLLDHRTMEVKALVGSADWFDEAIDGQVDGTAALRSPGSTLKPFVYALAFEQGLVHPRTLLKDSPVHFGGFTPENADGVFAGPVIAADALNRSRNVPAVELASRLEGDGLHGLLAQAKVPALRHADWYGLAIALGGAEVRMRDLARLYATLPNGGRLDALRTRASDPEPGRESLQVLTPESAYLVLEVLSANPRPDLSPLDRALVRTRGQIAWKTGTSHGFRDAWSVGVVGPYVLAVWLGNFDGTGDPALVGVKAAGPLFFRVTDALAARAEVVAMPEPRPAATNLSRIEVCAVSGGLPGAACPRRVSSWFIPGVSPIASCELHREVAVDATGRRACDPSADGVKRESHEFWPSDLLALFRLAGIPRRMPPPENPFCPLAEQASRGAAPAIVSPRSGVTYSVRSTDGDAMGVELAAVVDADVRRLYWFQDERLLGVTASGDTLTWKPGPGSYLVRAVDDHGRSASRPVHVERID